MQGLPLDVASQIVDKALEKRREMGFVPLTVAVLDAGGQLKVLKREDNSSLLRPEIAFGKAWGVSVWGSVASWPEGPPRRRYFSALCPICPVAAWCPIPVAC